MANIPSAPQNPLDPPIGPSYNVVMAMNSCVSTTENQDQTFSTEAFMDEFESCKNMSNEDIA